MLIALLLLASPANQTCVQAATIAFPSDNPDSTLLVATSTFASPCGLRDTAAAWFTMVTPTEGRYEFRTKGGLGITDTTLAIYSDCAQRPTSCVDDTQDSLLAGEYVDLPAGARIYIRVAGWGGSRGDLRLLADTFAGFRRPSNDECSAAIPLIQGVPLPTTTIFSTGTDSSSCGSDDSSDIWYTFQAPRADDYTFFITENQLSATLISLQTGCGTGELACGLASATTHLEQGQSIFVRVGTNPDAADTFNMNVGPLATSRVPGNDPYNQALALTVPSQTAGTTRGATDDGLNYGPTCGPFVNAAVWYSFTATVTGNYVFDTNGSEMLDTALGVFGPCLANGALPPQLLACDDDSGEGQHSRVEGRLMAGESICLAVAGRYLSEEGDFVLNARFASAPPPNDRCVTAQPLAFPDEVVAENFSSRPDNTVFPCPSGEFALWYAFTAPAEGVYKFDTKSTREAQPDIALFSTCGGAVMICNDNPNPAVSARLTAGQQVMVRVSSNVFTRGEIVLGVGPERPIAPVPDAGVASDDATAIADDATTEDAAAAADATPRADAAAVLHPDAAAIATADAAIRDADAVGELATEGCSCNEADGAPSVLHLLLGLVLLMGLRARPR